MNADAYRKDYRIVGLQLGVEVVDRSRNTDACTPRALRIVFVGDRVAKVDQQAIAQVLGAKNYRQLRAGAFAMWQAETCAC